MGPGRETCVALEGGTCNQVGRAGERDSCYEKRRHDCGSAHGERCGSVHGERCGSAHGERCGSVGASVDQLFEGADLYGRPIHHLESENSG